MERIRQRTHKYKIEESEGGKRRGEEPADTSGEGRGGGGYRGGRAAAAKSKKAT